MCLLLLITLVPLAIVFGVPFFGIFFGVSVAANALDKKKHGDEAPNSQQEREKRVAGQVATSAVTLLLLFIGFLVLRYYMT